MNLIEARTQVGLTQNNIAELAGVSHVTIVDIEAGKVFPSKTTRQRISATIGEVDWVGTRLRHFRLQIGSSAIAEAILDYVHNSTEAERHLKLEFLRELIKHL